MKRQIPKSKSFKPTKREDEVPVVQNKSFKDLRPETKRLNQLNQLIQKKAASTAVIQRNEDEVPAHRLNPTIQPPTREEWDEHDRKWN